MRTVSYTHLEGVFESKSPLDAFPAKIQDMILALARQENYSIEYMMASLLVAVSTAIGNAVNIRIRGGWISNSALYMILVGRPGMGKTPPLDFEMCIRDSLYKGMKR